MKNYFEAFMSTIVIMMIVMSITSLMTLESTLIGARRIHADAIEEYQLNPETFDLAAYNAKIQQDFPSWYITVEEADGNIYVDKLVTLHYGVYIPFFSLRSTGTIHGYVR